MREALSGRDPIVRGVLGRDDADAVGRAGGRAQRAADALLEAVLVPVQAVAAAVARVHRPLVLRVLLRDRLLEDLLQRDAEALECVGDDGHYLISTTRNAVTRALTVATGRRTFQPKRISWS